jgi:hypothetical protein
MPLVRSRPAQTASAGNKIPDQKKPIAYMDIISSWKAWAIILIIAGVWCITRRSEPEDKPVIHETIPCVRSLSIVKEKPLCIRVTTFEGAGDVFLREPGKPKILSSVVDVLVDQTFVVHEKLVGYNFTLEGMLDGQLKFSAAIVENNSTRAIKKRILVAPYTSTNKVTYVLNK